MTSSSDLTRGSLRRLVASSKRDAHRVTELRELLRTFDGQSAPVWDDAISVMHDLIGMEQSALFVFRRVDDGVGVDRLHIAGATQPVVDVKTITDAHFRKVRIWALYDPKNPETAQQNRALVVGPSAEHLAASAGARGQGQKAIAAKLGIEPHQLEERLVAFDHTDRTMLKPIGWSGRKQLRALLCDSGELLGWLGGMAQDVSPKQEALLGAIIPAFLERIRLERRLAATSIAVAGFDAAFQAIEAPAFLLRESGAVMHTNAAGRNALAEDGMAERLADAVHGRTTLEGLSITPLLSRGSPPHFLAVVRRPPHVREKVARAIAQWSLTPREGEVCFELALGRSNKEIATRFGCAESTVEVHVTRLLSKAESASRLELVARLWRSL